MKVIENGRGLVVGFEEIDFAKYPDLEVVGYNTTGEDHIPWHELNKRSIRAITLKGETEFLQSITSTSEHTIGLMIALARNYKRAFRTLDREIGHRLSGKTLGIIGVGRVGKQVINMTKGLGLYCWGFDPRGGLDKELTDLSLSGGGKVMMGSQIEIPLSNADYISLHIPLEGNEGFFTKEMFKQMKPTAYFINTSRAGVVEKGALLWALEHNEIAGAATDFIEDDLLTYKGDNLLLTNHLGGNTIEDRKATEEFMTNKVKEYLEK